MIKKLTPVGNSHAIILDKPLLSLVEADSSTQFQVEVSGGVIVLRPVKAEPRKRRARS